MVTSRYDSREIRELEAMVDKYPWYSLARKALVEKMSCLGDDYKEQALKESALYFWSRADLAKSVEAAVRKANEKTGQEHLKCENADVSERARASGYMLVGGDYFSTSEIAKVEQEAGGKDYYDRFHDGSMQIPSQGADRAPENEGGDAPVPVDKNGRIEEICTETLAEIYAKQELTSQAIEVYNKLILLYPEKSAYFATLIKDLENKNI
jgi:hypothetical protein